LPKMDAAGFEAFGKAAWPAQEAYVVGGSD